MSQQDVSKISEAIKITKKRRKKCNLAAIKIYQQGELFIPIDFELQLKEMAKCGLINIKEATQ